MERPSIIGLTVPNFSAPMTSGKTFKLSDYKGKNVIIYFYPKDHTPGCTAETGDFRDYYLQFKQENTEIFGISRDSLSSHESFKSKLDVPFELISDKDEAVCKMFDVLKEKKLYGKKVRGIERSTFIIDANGVLVKEWRGLKVPDHVAQVFDFLSKFNKNA